MKDTDRELVGGTAAVTSVDGVARGHPSLSNITQVDVKNENKMTGTENSNTGGAGNDKVLLTHSRDDSKIEIPATEFEQDSLDDDDGSNHAHAKGVLGASHNKER